MDKIELAKATGQIFIPSVMETDSAIEVGTLMMAARYAHPDRPLKLYINGYGGNTGQALAIADLINEDDNVEGYLIGEVYSSHILIWASCSKRFIGSHASMYLHSVHYTPDRAGSSRDLHLHAFHIEYTDFHVAELLAKISCGSCANSEYWLDLMRTAAGSLSMLTAQQIVERCMGEWM